MRKINKDLLVIILLFIVCFGALFGLFRSGNFFMHDDLQIMRLFQMERCLEDGQIPCRWVPDMGAGYGFPLFNYYPPLPYYSGMIFRLLGFSFISTMKILFLIALFASGVFMYFLVKTFSGKAAGFLAAVLYVYAPYHAVQVYVRGAMNEAWSMIFLPLALYGIYRFIDKGKLRHLLLSVLGISLILLSHNFMSLVLIVMVIAWTTVWIVKKRKVDKIPKTIAIYVLSFGLSAFFIIPAFFERSLVSIDSLFADYFNYEHHFASVKQLFFERKWGYGPSFPGPEDRLSFQIGWPHWWLVILATILFVYNLLKKNKKLLVPLGFGIGLFLASAFMTHGRSFYVWKLIPFLEFAQFPWRFLAISMFASSFAAGIMVGYFKHKVLFVTLIIIITVGVNVSYFKPKEYYPEINDQRKLSGQEFENQSMAAINDYLPISVEDAPLILAPNKPIVIDGDASFSDINKRSSFWHFDVEVYSDSAKVKVPIFDYPKWQVLIDGTKVEHTHWSPTGEMVVSVPQGKHIVVGWFENTRIRLVANLITAFSFVSIIFLLVYYDLSGKKI